MSHGAGAGDKLARGAVRATYASTEGGVTEDKWAEAFGDFDPKKFAAEPNKSSVRTEDNSGDASSESSGNVGVELGAAESSEPITR
jgi:hypothetical protein